MPAKAGALNARQMSEMVPTRIFMLRILRNHDFRLAIVASPDCTPSHSNWSRFYREFPFWTSGVQFSIYQTATLRSWELHYFLREPSPPPQGGVVALRTKSKAGKYDDTWTGWNPSAVRAVIELVIHRLSHRPVKVCGQNVHREAASSFEDIPGVHDIEVDEKEAPIGAATVRERCWRCP